MSKKTGIDKEIEYMEKEGVREKSKIVKLEIKPASELFGDQAKQPDRPILRISCENGANLNTSARGLEINSEELCITNKAIFLRSIKNELSKLGKFLKKYGEAPKTGMTVDTVMDEDGYMRIEV
jgi:hypothetical protein